MDKEKDESLLIEYEEWHHTCADGCCDRWGIEVWVDGKSIGSREFGDAGSVLELFLESEGRDCIIKKVSR
jgi:hypothetical protein